MLHTVPPLPYNYDALEPFIDRDTMHLHHDRHHAVHVEKLNAACERFPLLRKQDLEEQLSHLDALPEEVRGIVRYHGGGHLNHSLFWSGMSANGTGLAMGTVELAIHETFGSMVNFKKRFIRAGLDHLGCGWVWLVLNGDSKLRITTTAGQDNPLMFGHVPLLGNDLWEHAYYLKYQEWCGAYLDAWFEVVNWQEVESRFRSALASNKQ